MPDFLADEAIRGGVLVTVLDHFLVDPGQFLILWSSGRQMSSRLRAFIDFVSNGCLSSLFNEASRDDQA